MRHKCDTATLKAERLRTLVAVVDFGSFAKGRFRHASFGIERLTKNVRGTSAVEFAIVAPVFLMLVLGIVGYGSYLAMVHGVQQLAAEAARAAIGGMSDSERAALAQSNINANVGS